MKPLVIYHANCTDGFGAAFAAWLKLGDKAEYLPMDYLKATDGVAEFHERVKIDCSIGEREVYILDFSLPKAVMDWLFGHAKRVVWLDHHRSAFEMWCGKSPDLFFTTHKEQDESKTIILDDCRSGAMLAWKYFHPGTEVPMLIQHIDDRDRWQFKMEGSRELHAVLASLKPWSFEQWDAILAETSYRATDGTGIDSFYDDGTVLLRAHSQQVQSALKQAIKCKIVIKTEQYGCTGERGLAVNAPFGLASDLGHELANKSGTFGLVWSLAADRTAHCSLRSNGDYDVSAIAKCFGGGGHRNAAGFSTNVETLLEWLK